MEKYTIVIETEENKTVEEVLRMVLKKENPGRLVYAYKRDAVADLHHVLANSGTVDRLVSAVERVRRGWW